MSVCKRSVLTQLGFHKTKEIEIIMPSLSVILDCKGEKRQCEIFAQSARALLPRKKNKRIFRVSPQSHSLFSPSPPDHSFGRSRARS